MGATERLADFAAHGSFHAIPSEAREAAKTRILDTLGVMLAGASVDGTRLVHGWVREMDGRDDAEVIGAGFRAPAALAALANGSAGHALDYDDTMLFTTNAATYGTRLHPTTPTLAAALAVAEHTRASGGDLLTAFVYGFEVTCRVADATNREHYRRGYHPTGVIAPLGAAVAAGRLLGLNRAGLQHALGVAATCGGGLRANYGTMTKPLHAGRAAESGVLAASLVARGFTASDQVLEADRGFFQAFAGDFDETLLLGRIGAPFYVVRPGSAIKPYPTGSLTHAALDAAFDLMREHNLRAEDIEQVDVGSNSNLLGSLIHSDARDGLQAKFSMQACMALAFVERNVGIAQLQDAVVARSDIQALMRKVRLHVDPELEALGFDQPRANVQVRLRDGREIAGRADAAQGTTDKPLRRDQLLAKFRDCATLVIPQTQTDALISMVDRLEHELDMSRLVRLLRPA